jgi:hypothetical protein
MQRRRDAEVRAAGSGQRAAGVGARWSRQSLGERRATLGSTRPVLPRGSEHVAAGARAPNLGSVVLRQARYCSVSSSQQPAASQQPASSQPAASRWAAPGPRRAQRPRASGRQASCAGRASSHGVTTAVPDKAIGAGGASNMYARSQNLLACGAAPWDPPHPRI